MKSAPSSEVPTRARSRRAACARPGRLSQRHATATSSRLPTCKSARHVLPISRAASASPRHPSIPSRALARRAGNRRPYCGIFLNRPGTQSSRRGTVWSWTCRAPSTVGVAEAAEADAEGIGRQNHCRVAAIACPRWPRNKARCPRTFCTCSCLKVSSCRHASGVEGSSENVVLGRSVAAPHLPSPPFSRGDACAQPCQRGKLRITKVGSQNGSMHGACAPTPGPRPQAPALPSGLSGRERNEKARACFAALMTGGHLAGAHMSAVVANW